MKLNHKTLILMAALSAGAAYAGPATSFATTPAGTIIVNTAKADYDISNPSGTTTNETVTSNQVQTTVLPKPNFDIVFNDGLTSDAGTQNSPNNTTKKYPNVLPGAVIVTPYSAVNLGNVDLLVKVDFWSGFDLTGVDPTTIHTVKYYLATADTNNDGTLSAAEITNATAITQISLNRDDVATGTDEGIINFFQVVTLPPTLTLPAGGPVSATYPATPVGTVLGTGTNLDTSTGNVTGNGYATGVLGQEDNQTNDLALASNQDLQFVEIKTLVSSATADPIDSTAGTDNDTTTIPTQDDPSTTITPPTTTTPVTGYPSTDTIPVDIKVLDDEQVAYPKGDTDTTADTVTFTNSISNTSPADDVYNLISSTLPTGVTVTYTDMAGNPLTDTDNDGNVDLPVAADTTVLYKTVITYPDANDTAPIDAISIETSIDSANFGGTNILDTTTNTIYPPAMQFGDSDTVVTTANPAGTPIQIVTPNGTFDTSNPTNSPNTTDSTASFPMDIVNNGQYDDTFTLVGSVDFGSGPVAVKYYDANGTEIPKVAGVYTTPVVAAGGELKVFAVVDVPTGTASADYSVSQTATGVYSELVATDVNDTIRVQPFGKVGMAKFSNLANAPAETVTTANGVTIVGNTGYTTGITGILPCERISYQIIAKNDYNTPLKAFKIVDTLPTNTTSGAYLIGASSVLGSVSNTNAIIKIGANGTWELIGFSSLQLAAGDEMYIAVDDLNLPGEQPAPLAAGAIFTVTIGANVDGYNCGTGPV